MIAAGVITPEPGDMMTFVDFIWGSDETQPREEIQGLFDLMSTQKGTFLTEFDGNTIVVAHMPIAEGQWVLNISQPLGWRGSAMIKEALVGNLLIGVVLAIILLASTIILCVTVIRNVITSYSIHYTKLYDSCIYNTLRNSVRHI